MNNVERHLKHEGFLDTVRKRGNPGFLGTADEMQCHPTVVATTL
jgi:hypothetical protein